MSGIAALGLLVPGLASAVSPAQAAEIPPGLVPFYSQTLEWSVCQPDLDCAWLTVPRDYADPTGPTIRLRVSRAKATGVASARQGSLVVNPGGPGAAGLDLASYVANGVAPAVAEQFDIVGFDPRGVGASAPITCMTGRQTTRFLRADGAPDTPAEELRLMSLAARLAQGCLDKSPFIARHVGSENTVRDLDILRTALGDGKLNWLGFSYGTYLGTRYAELFPDKVGRFVLDGPIDPSLDGMQGSKDQSAGFQVAITRFARDCVKRVTCPWKGSPDRVLRGINRLLATLDSTSYPTHRGEYLNQAEALNAIIYSLYSPILWPSLRIALGQAKVGDGLGLQSIFDMANDRTGPNSYGDNMASAFPAILCWDQPPPPGADGLRAAAAEWSQGAPVPELARTLAWGNATCSSWFGHQERPPAPASSTTTAPILIVGTTYDPATPLTWAQALNRQLPTSTLLTFRGDGHTAFGNGSRCVDHAVVDYLLTGRVPAAGTVCR